MTTSQVLILGAMICFAIVVSAFLLRNRGSKTGLAERANVVSAASGIEQVTSVVEAEAAHEILIGLDPSQPALRISPLADEQRFARATVAPLQGSLAGRLNSALQAAPALLTKGELASGRKYMEVVVNGDLVRSSTGEGYRAFTRGAKGIKEHAVLHDPNRLQNVVNAAAVWQVASVVVAQKHLADISAKLDTISEGVNRLEKFLSDARRSLIVATHGYLRQAAEAIRNGELSDALRNQLESCERDLLTTYEHLVSEFRGQATKDVKHTETVGTEQLTADLKAKHKQLEGLADEMALCVQTRVLAWYVWSVYPGESSFKAARRRSIEECIAEFNKLDVLRAEALESDLNKVKAFFNFGSTLEERKNAIRSQSDVTKLVLDRNQRQSRDELSRSASLLLTHDRPTSLVLEVQNGKLGEVRMLEAA